MERNIKKSFVSPFRLFAHSPIHRKEGFTLVELAMVLVVIGLLIGFGMGLIGPLTKRAKLIETRETVKQAKEAVLGYAVKNGYLPANLEAAGARRLDAWTRDLQYFTATELVGSAANVCSREEASLTVRECTNTDCSSFLAKSNIAFVVYSNGEDADGACTGTTSPFYVREQAMGYNSPCTYTTTNPAFNYDDVVAYVSLDEIRSLRGCPQPLRITSPAALDQGEEDSFYSYSLQAMGGMPPYTWTGTAGSGLALNSAGLISGMLNFRDAAPNTGELANCSETLTVTAAVSDSAGSRDPATGTRSFAIPVRPKPLTIITQSIPSATEGSPYSATITASGGRTPYSWNMSVSPPCPTGLTCSGNSISGTPNTGTARTYTVTSTVNDTCTTNTRSFVLTINPSGVGGGCTPLSLTPPSGTSWAATVGSAFSQSIAVSGGQTPYTNTQCTPSSCNNLSLSCTSTGATISGTPNAAGTCTFGVAWRDSCSAGAQTINGTYTVNISTPPPPTCSLSAPGVVQRGLPVTLSWSITNGPANGSFSPPSGRCTSFTNSTVGSCTTDPLFTVGFHTFTLTLSPGGRTCEVTVRVVNYPPGYELDHSD